MTTLRKAAEKALDALIAATPVKAKDPQIQADAIVALREALAEPEPEPVAWMDREGDLYKMPEIEGWAPPHTFLYTTPPQHPTETEAEYGSEADTAELLRVGAMPEPLRLAAMLEKTMQWPLHGIAADCLRRMHNEAQRKPLTDAQAHLLFLKLCERMTVEETLNSQFAMFLDILRDCERAHGIA